MNWTWSPWPLHQTVQSTHDQNWPKSFISQTAATKIQSNYRGYQTRKQLANDRENDTTADDENKQDEEHPEDNPDQVAAEPGEQEKVNNRWT